jgi:hypothetical protein
MIFLTNRVVAQNLTLAQLLELRKMELGAAEEFLSAKGWEFSKAEEPTDSTMGSVTFAYNKSEMSSGAESFLKYLYSIFSGNKRVVIQVNSTKKYNEYLNSLKASGLKLVNSRVEEGELVKIYKNSTLVVEITATTIANLFDKDTAIWNLAIFSRKDYELEFE